MRTLKGRFYYTLGSFLSLAVISHPAGAAGFQMVLQNATNLGTAYAGTAALAEDASTNFYNTAGLTRLPNEQIAFGGVLSIPQTKVNVTRATANTGALLTPSTGTARPSSTGVLPFLHYAKRIDDNWTFGFSAAVPFGSKADYKIDSIVRYTTTRAEMKTIDLAPSLAYQFNNGFSLGAGVDALNMLTKIDNRLASAAGPNPSADGFSENTYQNWALGYHVGGLYEANDCTRFGVQYHSKYDVKTRGDSVTQFSGLPFSTRQGLKADFNLPDTAILSAYHAFNDRWTVMADVQWTRWSRFKQLTTRFDDGTQLIINENYKNVYRVAAGGTYQYSDPWRFRFGVMFDKSPIPDINRNIFIPNQNRILPAVGAQYRICKTLALDFGYSHIFFKKDNNLNIVAPTTVGVPPAFAPQQNLQGSIRNRLDAIGLQLTWDIEPR